MNYYLFTLMKKVAGVKKKSFKKVSKLLKQSNFNDTVTQPWHDGDYNDQA